MQRITTENTTLKQRIRQLTADNRVLNERLEAARFNIRFQDRRVAGASSASGRALADELRLVVFPVVLGSGLRIFDETSDKKPLHLGDTRKMGDGLVFCTYEFVPGWRL